MHQSIYIFMGAPGSGKGTLAKLAESKLGFVSLSTGEMLREQIALGSMLGKLAEGLINNGKLIPDELMSSLVLSWLSGQNPQASIILDGYPRTLPQAQVFIEELKLFKNAPKKPIVVLFELDQDTLIERMQHRLICANIECKSVYSAKLLSDGVLNCPKCQSALVVRKDDTLEVFLERLAVYNKHKRELLAFYSLAGLKTIVLEVKNKTPEQIFEEFKEKLDSLPGGKA